MMALAGSVLAASVLGSLHCAGMCGGLAAACSAPTSCVARRTRASTVAYHAGRLASYALVGAISGAVGIVLQRGGSFVGVQQAAALVAGIVVALSGVAMLMAHAAPRVGKACTPPVLQSLTTRIIRCSMLLDPVARAAILGVATPLLPCGWLWAFAIVAAGTASTLQGAVVMVAFWLGTVPILALIGTGVHALGTRHRQMVGALAGVAMIAVGLHTAFVRAEKADHVANAVGGQPGRPGDASGPLELPGDEVPACCRIGTASEATVGRR
jgi:sulfite exporter TauE/SafE